MMIRSLDDSPAFTALATAAANLTLAERTILTGEAMDAAHICADRAAEQPEKAERWLRLSRWNHALGALLAETRLPDGNDDEPGEFLGDASY